MLPKTSVMSGTSSFFKGSGYLGASGSSQDWSLWKAMEFGSGKSNYRPIKVQVYTLGDRYKSS